jgi:two-component system response regulator YesN
LKSEFSILLGDLLSLTMKLYQENSVPFPEAEQNGILGVNMEKARSYFGRLLAGLIDAIGGRQPFSWAVNSVIEYVRQHYKEDIGITDMGRYCGLNPSYMSTIFKKETGIGLAQYVGRVRVQAAVSLMLGRNIPPTQVYELVGFRNYNNFFNIFKQITGITPKQFREEGSIDWVSRLNSLDELPDISIS